MAERTQGEITIAAEPRAIMDVIADFEAYPEWASGVKKSEIQERDGDGRERADLQVRNRRSLGWRIEPFQSESFHAT